MHFDPALVSGDFRLKVTSVVLPLNSPALMLAANSSRVSFVFTNLNSAIIIRPGVFDSSLQGIQIPSNSAPFIWKFSDLGGLIGMEWYAISQTGETLLVFETIYYPSSGEDHVL